MPMTDQFKDRLFPILEAVSNHFGTPFHIYDEAGIRATAESVSYTHLTLPTTPYV